MARVTVEDCVVKVPNRFELVLLAAHRAREITSGSPLSIDRDDDKNPVVALREIADETVGLPHLREAVVRGMQKHVELDEAEETHELEVDPSVFGFAAPGGVLSADEVGAEAQDFEDAEIADEAELEDDLVIDQGFAIDGDAVGEDAVDENAVDEDAVDEDLTADVLSVDAEEEGEADAKREDDLPEDDLREDDLPEDDLPEDDLPEDDEEL